jgi:hypothetical protein
MATKGELLAAAADAPQRRDDRAEYIRAVIAAGVAQAYLTPRKPTADEARSLPARNELERESGRRGSA